ncbi:MAG: adenosylcobalamin-dependent ribonucleoside-diphosphate reductase [Candidatus Hermodarchaeia archaeon]
MPFLLTGNSFDKPRPTGDIVASSGGTTSGPISFLGVFSKTTSAIQQGAFRRGANMCMMSLEHPDILNFITAKGDPSAFTNFNLSVKITDGFMEKLQNAPRAPHVVTNPRTKKQYVIPRSIGTRPYTINDLVPADEKSETDCYTIKDIWEMIVRYAHATGEPGICFIDRINEDNPTPNLGRIEATNPCGEQPLLPYEACNLGLINVSKFVLEDKTDLYWTSLAKTIELAVRFLDDVIDANYYPVKEIRKITLGNRKIGLGVMGFADTLILLGIRYNSKEAVKFAGKLACFIQKRAHQTSEKLAKERGCFPNWKGSIWDTKYDRPMLNAAVATIAPTGSISRIAGCNGGIEPIFKIVKKHKIQDGQDFIQLHSLVEELGAKEGWLSYRIRNLQDGCLIGSVIC